MSKIEVKKYVNSLDKNTLVKLIMDLYSAHKEVKDILEYTIHPNDNAKLEEYKAIIKQEFYPKRGYGKMRFSVCRKAVKDYKALDPSPFLLADLMLCIPEYTAQIADDWGDMQETFYDSTCNNFNAAMKYIEKNQLLSQFETRIQHILKNSESSGYAFPDIMYQIYEEHNKMNT